MELLEASSWAPGCLQRPLCDANLELTRQYGAVGRVAAALLSNVAAKAFSQDDHRRFHMALKAAEHGRSAPSCDAFRACSSSFTHTPNASTSAAEDRPEGAANLTAPAPDEAQPGAFEGLSNDL